MRRFLLAATALLVSTALAVAQTATSFPFSPTSWTSNILAATTTTARVVLTRPAARNPACRVWNSGTVAAHVAFGDGTVVATTTNYPVPPGALEVIGVKQNETNMAGITGSGNATLYVNCGQGL